MALAALIVAAGRGARARAAGDTPKQYAELAGRSVLAHAIAPLASHPAIAAIKVVIHPDDAARYSGAVGDLAGSLLEPVAGGATRQASVLAGLESLAQGQPPEAVLIHDAARPFLSRAEVDRLLAALTVHEGAILAVPVADTLKRASGDGTIAATVDRTGLWRAQTPQAFRFAPILAAHRRAANQSAAAFTDDASIAEWAGMTITIVEGSARNTKITTAEDLTMAAHLFATGGLETRTGTGFDVHRFAPGDHVWLCGVRVPHNERLEGHSDADVGLHALTDALLGALGDGDIGQHFPPTDARWKGAPSRLFLVDAAKRVAARGGRIINVDVTLLCEAPRIGPHRDAMRATIASLLGVSADRVGVKATTTEGLGFVGRREGIAAMATANVLLPG